MVKILLCFIFIFIQAAKEAYELDSLAIFVIFVCSAMRPYELDSSQLSALHTRSLKRLITGEGTMAYKGCPPSARDEETAATPKPVFQLHFTQQTLDR